MFKIILLVCLCTGALKKSEAFWNIQDLLQEYLPFLQNENISQKTVITKELKEVCDEKQLILQLARLYITSPERITLLVSRKSVSKGCLEVADVLQHINNTIKDSIPLPKDNLYMKLYNALDYYNSYVCLSNPNTRGNHLTNYHECLRELHDELIECEGPPDWFEKSNEALVCLYYNEIINCNYIKAGMLCGLKPALILRSFANEIMKRIVTFKCKISRSLPYIDDPMPASGGNCPMKCFKNFLFYTLLTIPFFIYIFKHFPYL